MDNRICMQIYRTPHGFSDILLFAECETNRLTGLFFDGSQDAEYFNDKTRTYTNLPVFGEAAAWLDEYFAGGIPSFTPEYLLDDISDFRREVLEIVSKIPYGETMTYGEIAKTLAARRGIPVMSARAVGGAVGGNPLCILIPCHRLVGAGGKLTGYGGGIENKRALLGLEGHDYL